MPTVLNGNESFNTLYNPTTQVFKATHKIEGGAWKRSSLMNRSFISFTYGGKAIEDFNLIAVTQGDRMQKNIYSEFEDITTSYEVLDGEFYWGTHFTKNSLNLTLATDGITDFQLNEFKQWFMPGTIKELVLAENPNRGILARIASVPVYSLLPFEEKITMKIDDTDYITSTTLYKGEISLSFAMDEPFWYARKNLIEYYYTDENDKLGSMTSDSQAIGIKETINDADFIKVAVEDNIPYASMLRTDAILGDNIYALIYGDEDDDEVGSSVLGNANNQGDYRYAHVDDGELPYTAIIGVKLGAATAGISTTQININSTTPRYLYYSGTAPSKPVITFTLAPHIVDGHIVAPFNQYSTNLTVNTNKTPYNILTIGSEVMKFTTPSLYNGYNQAIEIVDKFNTGESVLDIETALKVGVNEYYSRAWALLCVQILKTLPADVNQTTLAITANFITDFHTRMRYFITSDGSNNYYNVTFTINSKTGEVSGNFTIRANTSNVISTDMTSYSTIQVEEDVGDMIRSGLIEIKDRNFPDGRGHINNLQCSAVTTDYPASYGGLQNLLITYKNMYL